MSTRILEFFFPPFVPSSLCSPCLLFFDISSPHTPSIFHLLLLLFLFIFFSFTLLHHLAGQSRIWYSFNLVPSADFAINSRSPHSTSTASATRKSPTSTGMADSPLASEIGNAFIDEITYTPSSIVGSPSGLYVSPSADAPYSASASSHATSSAIPIRSGKLASDSKASESSHSLAPGFDVKGEFDFDSMSYKGGTDDDRSVSGFFFVFFFFASLIQIHTLCVSVDC